MKLKPRISPFFICLAALMAGCAGGSKLATKATAAQQRSLQLPDSLNRRLAAGIDFFAQGDQPVAWTLDMDADKGYYFKTSNGITMNTAPVKGVRNSGTGLTSYTASDTQGDIAIFVYDAGCSNQPSSKKVAITLNNTHYTGCGTALYNVSLNDTWILEKAGNTIINGKDFPAGAPKISFDISAGKMTANDGCGNISSAMQMMGSRIKFENISSSKTGCKNTLVQNIFAEKISNQVADYYFKDGKLYLYLVDDSLLIFKKA